MKKALTLFVVLLMLVALPMACTKKADDGAATEVLKVGMVTDAGTIDDKSFNQGTWEGVLLAGEDLDVDTKYLKPTGTTEADYLKEIGNLIDAGYTFVVTPGFKFETAIFAAQDKYPEAKFVLIDGTPHSADWSEFRAEDNVVSIFFAEQESGFLAGVAAALQQQEGSFGFIGGMEIPPVQKFNWGFQQGVNYANANLGTQIAMDVDNVIYQGSFDNVAAGQQLAAQMYEKGVDVIFCAAGGVGVGAINEAKARAASGEDVWIVGVDVDQYADGIYSGDMSVILTSAMKRIDQAAYDMIKTEVEGNFPGGDTLIFDASNNGVGIPQDNPNLDADVEAQVDDIFEAIQDGTIVVSAEQGDLIQ